MDDHCITTENPARIISTMFYAQLMAGRVVRPSECDAWGEWKGWWWCSLRDFITTRLLVPALGARVRVLLMPQQQLLVEIVPIMTIV